MLAAGSAQAVDLRDWGKKFDDASERFVVLAEFNNEAVLDKETQLVWHRSPFGFDDSWNYVFRYCLSRGIGGRLGWRLPTSEELASLAVQINLGTFGLPPGHPFQNVQNDLYWTATTDPSNVAQAHARYPGGGGLFVAKSSFNYFWCVRGGQGYDGR
jgi:hypothetical protein